MKIRALHYSFHRWSLAITAAYTVIVFLSFCTTALAAKPFLEKMDLFEEMTDGFVLYRIPGIVVTSKGSVLASDAMFPFPDVVEAAAAGGVTAIIQPGGSIRDEDSIKAADKHNIAMVFTGVRHFRH